MKKHFCTCQDGLNTSRHSQRGRWERGNELYEHQYKLEEINMKKWIVIGFIGFLAVFIIVKQLNHNDFSASKQLAESGKYEEFYASIQNEIERGNSAAKEILVEYFFKAIDDEDVEEVKFYLEQDSNIINSASKNKSRADESRAMDTALTVEDEINVNLIRLLLVYKPELDYEILVDKEKLTFSEIASIHCASAKNGSEVLKLLLEAGMNPNLLTDAQNGYSKYPPLYTSYRYDNIDVFKQLLKHTSDINPIVITAKHKDTLTQLMMNEYLKVIEENGTKLEHPATSLLVKTRQSSKYRQVHNKNMKYFMAMLNSGLITRTSTREIRNIFVYLASTGEEDATRLFVKNGVCQQYQDLCVLAAHAAKRDNLHHVVNIIKKGN